jgi:hypothetical protein
MKLSDKLLNHSLHASAKEKKWQQLIPYIKEIIPDLSKQYTNVKFTDKDIFIQQKLRQLHAFQINLLLKTIEMFRQNHDYKPQFIDIGDSAGSHYLYIKKIFSEKKYDYDWLSVNLDPVAVQKTTEKGIPSINCRAEELHVHGLKPDICSSFEMCEHLLDPIKFFYNMAKKSSVKYFCITIPYLKNSRVGFHHIRQNEKSKKVHAENVHIFELSSDDWDLVFKFSGWKISYSEKYLQYPNSGLFRLTQPLWKKWDFEGFYGVILEKDPTYSDLYQDW